MVSIYCIEDINDNKYVGSTKQKYLAGRLSKHRYDKSVNHYCSSSKLNLDYCIIYELEKCNEEDRKEREQYWKDNTDCVNEKNILFNDKEYNKEYQKNNREKINTKQREYRKNNIEERRKKDRERYYKNKEQKLKYQKEYYKNKKLLSK
tara:strand:- start:76 stop:522 length:447 start_codon:yes stop_codon:yes gene_type:complete